MSHKLVVVHSTAGQMQANIIKSLLEAEGIPAEIAQEGAGVAFGFTVGALGIADILVPEEYEAQARSVLAAMQSGDLEDKGATTDFTDYTEEESS
jgi:hypothetical protein